MQGEGSPLLFQLCERIRNEASLSSSQGSSMCNVRMAVEEEPWDIHSCIRVLTVDSNTQDATTITSTMFSAFTNLAELRVGSGCFENVEKVELIGLPTLEKVVIGDNCFTKHKNRFGLNEKRRFSVRYCERLKELRIGRYSFSDYTVCAIENMPSLEVIEFGEVDYVSCNFFYASMELRSESLKRRMTNRPVNAEIPCVW
ncbi:hypothetical protein WA577_004723 [Blastocystis sp. JDR]